MHKKAAIIVYIIHSTLLKSLFMKKELVAPNCISQTFIPLFIS